MKYPPATLPFILYKGLSHYQKGTFVSTKQKGTWIDISAQNFKEKVQYFALGLYSLGVRPGDKVTIHAENSTEWLICDIAALSIGVVDVPIYTTQPGNQIKYIIENSEAKVHIVSNDKLFSETKSIIKPVKSVQAIITLFGSNHKKLKPFEQILEAGRDLYREKPDLFEELSSKVQPHDLATLIYTSGTTGLPKGVMLTHNNISSNVRGSLDKLPLPAESFRDENVLSYLPLSHVFERMITYMYICMSAKIHYIEDIEEIRDDFMYVKPFFFASVPRLLEKIHTGVKVRGQEFSGLKKNLYYWALHRAEKYNPEYPPRGFESVKQTIADKLIYSKIKELFGGNLEGIVSGGAALSPEVFRFINALGITCVQGYGLTETSPVITVQTPGEMRIGSSGKPLHDVEVTVAEDKEILTRGPNVMKGYFKLPEQTDDVFTKDGWFKTGDIGKIDEDGFLYITDRKKSMFKLSTGKYVAPQNIENQLTNSGYIDQVVVIGYRRKFCSALIVPDYKNVQKRLNRNGHTSSGSLHQDPEVISLIQKEVDKANRQLSPWETVKKFVLLEEPLSIDAGELTPTMKVKRLEVLEKYQKQIDSMYEEENIVAS